MGPMAADPGSEIIDRILDRNPDIVIDETCAATRLAQAFWAETCLNVLTGAVQSVTGVTTVLKNASGRARSLEGLDDILAVLASTPPTNPIPVPMNGVTYMTDVTGGQKTGLLYAQRPNHALPPASCALGSGPVDFRFAGCFTVQKTSGEHVRSFLADRRPDDAP